MSCFEYIGCGRNRMAFRHGNYVFKIPLNERGISDNYHERYMYLHDNESGIAYARCRLLGCILVMQYARFVGPFSDRDGYIPWSSCPPWASYVDCCQVGYNRFGKIVAYDYGRF